MGRGSITPQSGTKKIFVPTIPQRRVKKENVQCVENISTKKRDSGDGRDKRGRGRGRRDYISVGGALFSEGLSGPIKKVSDASSHTRETPICKPVLTPYKKRTKKEIEDEEQKLQDEDEEYFESDEEEGDLPAILPFKTFLEASVKTETKQVVKIKSEEKPQIKTADGVNSGKFKTETTVKSEGLSEMKDIKRIFNEDNIQNIFHADNDDYEELLLIQFPANMSIENEVSSNDISIEKVSTSSQQQESAKEKVSEEEKEIGANLTDIEEGFIGKLQLMKSGNIRLVCGSTIMYIEQSKPLFMEDLMLITETQDSEPEMVALGKIGRHIVLSPVINNEIKI